MSIRSNISKVGVIKLVIASVAAGIIYWASGLITSSSDIVYGIVTFAAFPLVIGLIFKAITPKASVPFTLSYCMLAFITRLLLIVFRQFLVFFGDEHLIGYITSTFYSFLYAAPFQILFSLLGCVVINKLRRRSHPHKGAELHRHSEIER